ncbi:related to suppressor protein PSP1 [Sporisorium reilianum SRZ2]|uniref:Related to suppressor protein PSP1 n=1 Tax=Sporisorium reilianum (strain SRZ2) TaxID=999809 RepID=E6ZRS5_SPORE|nr:related to suppressor protein PSP1 [Sporisorium reilianum SRZ2]
MSERVEPAQSRAVQIGATDASVSANPTASAPRHSNASSPDSSPTPSNPSHPASLNGDDARHGTSPATSIDVPSMPPAGLKLDLSSSGAHSRQEQQASLSRAGVARSPHPLDGSQEARSSLAARSGGILATMQEEDGPAFSESRRDSTLGFDPNPSYSHMEQAMRASRHRSASSAAALALHGSAAPFVDRWAKNAAGRIAPAPGVSSRTIWEGPNTDSMASNASPNPAMPQRPVPPLQRGFSASFVRSKPEPASPSPFLSSPAGFHDLGFDFFDPSLRTSRASVHATTASPFGAMPDLPQLSSYPDSAAAADMGGQDSQRPSAGTESRRHSVAGTGPNREPAGVIGGHRRAIGFDVADSYAREANGSWPRAVSHGRDRSVSSVIPGFNPFAGSSLALSVDDLEGDYQFEPSPRHDAQRSDLPGSSASDASPYAASMPSAFDDRGFGSFEGGSVGLNETPQARGHRGGGRDSLSASWDTMTPSQMAARSPGEGQRTLAEMTRQLRQMSIGEGDLRARPHLAGVASIFDSQTEGTRTVRASPGTSPTGMRGSAMDSSASASTGRGLSAQAKSFTSISQARATMAQDQVDTGGYAAVGPVDMPFYGYAAGPALGPSGRIMPQMAAVPPFLPPPPPPPPQQQQQQQLAGFGASVIGGLPGLGPLPSMSTSSNDLTFSSLAALGPMPPSSMGPFGGFGGAAGGALSSAGTTSELQDLGKGVPLTSLSKETPLYIVEFKQGRTDLFFRSTLPSQSPSNRDGEPIRRGDLVIVEADRGKDLGTVVNDSITVEQVQAFLAHQSDLTIGTAAGGGGGGAAAAAAAVAGLQGQGGLLAGAGGAGSGAGDETSSNASGLSGSPTSTTGGSQASVSTHAMAGARPMRTISPKRLFTKATAADTSTLYSKAQDEERALQLCISKVMQRGLPMSVVAAEMQWDRRKLTFYYTASMRVDFRDLVKELFRLYKTRIWMCHLGHPSGAGMG